MQLWVAAILFIACIGRVAVSIKQYCNSENIKKIENSVNSENSLNSENSVKSKNSEKARFIVLTASASLLALALFTYIGLTLILLDRAGG